MTAKQYISPAITAKEILHLVERETGLMLTNIDMGSYQRLTKAHAQYLPRIVAATVMMQEGIKACTASRVLGIKYSLFYQLANLGNTLLGSRPGMKGYDKQFKKLFLAVMAGIAEMEDNEA